MGVNWRGEQVMMQIGKNAEDCVEDASLDLMTNLIRMLNQRGSGTLYRKNKGKKSKGKQIPRRDVQKRVDIAKSHGMLADLNVRAYGFHQASKEGEPPAPDTSTLQRSVQRDLSKLSTDLMIRVGSGLKYGFYLEFGTSRGIAPRPWMRPKLEEFEDEFSKFFTPDKLMKGV